MSSPSWEPEPAETDGTLVENWLFRLGRERFRSRLSGKGHDFYVMRLADSVNVVALTEDRKLVLVRQFRAGSNSDGLETPGGLLEPGEDPRDAGARELLEETGYLGDPPILLGEVWSNPSIMTSKSATVLITKARKVDEPKFDASEEVVVELVPSENVLALIKTGAIGHALTVAGLFWWLIAEIPGTPLARPAAIKPKFQFRIRTLLAVVAASALLFSFLANLTTTPLGLLIMLTSLFLAGVFYTMISLMRIRQRSLPTLASEMAAELKRTRAVLTAAMLLLFTFFTTVVWITVLLVIFKRL